MISHSNLLTLMFPSYYSAVFRIFVLAPLVCYWMPRHAASLNLNHSAEHSNFSYAALCIEHPVKLVWSALLYICTLHGICVGAQN